MPTVASPSLAPVQESRASRRYDQRFYWIATGLFCLLFIGSFMLTVGDPETSREQFRDLSYPDNLVYWSAIAKLLGVVAILSNRSRTVTLFAFAGFLYDLLLALSQHIATSDWDGGSLAVFGLILWVGAFAADRRRFGGAAARA